MFHRVLGLSSILLVCLAGCSLRGHRDSGCHQHGRLQRHSANLNNTCGPDEICTCTAPLYLGDQQCHRNCRKHRRQRPMRRMATAFRRNSPQWLSGFGTCECESCCDQACMLGPMTGGPTMCGQSGYMQSSWGSQQTCGCDSCATSMSDGWLEGAATSGEWYQNSADQHASGCGCGEGHHTGSSDYFPESNGAYEYSAETPMMSIPPQHQNNNVPRSFPPSMPHDMTPMDPPMVLPRTDPDVFDPAAEHGVPPAEKTLDPVSYEIPRLPPIPDRSQNASFGRVESHPLRPIENSSQQSLR